MRNRFNSTITTALALSLSILSLCFGDCPLFEPALQVGTVQYNSIDEASGLAASRKNPDVFWIHNDSGDSARIFALNSQGTHLGVYNLTGAEARDYEDIAIGPGPIDGQDYIYIADIGDNPKKRSNIVVYRVLEPAVDSQQSPVTENLSLVESITLQYPGGARNAETLMVDPVNKDIYIISKSDDPSKVYRAPYPQSTSGTTTLEYKGDLPWGTAVGGDISPSGDLIIVRRDDNASVWLRAAGTDLWDAFSGTECAVSVASEPQGEAVCFDSDSCGYYTTSEGDDQPIYYYARSTQCPPHVSGDFDSNGTVNEPDLLFLAGYWLDPACTPEPSLLAHWKLDGDPNDTSGYGNHGTVYGGVWDPNGQIGQALKFDGIDDYVQMDVTGFKGILGSYPRSCTAWIKTNTTGMIVTWGQDVTGGKWVFKVHDTGTIRVSVQGGYIAGSTDLGDGQWHHVAAVLPYDGSPDVSEIELYVDGVLEATTASSSQLIETLSGPDVEIASYTTAVDPEYFGGPIDDVRIYAIALDEAQISTLAESNCIAHLPVNLDDTGIVNLADFTVFAGFWLETLP